MTSNRLQTIVFGAVLVGCPTGTDTEDSDSGGGPGGDGGTGADDGGITSAGGDDGADGSGPGDSDSGGDDGPVPSGGCFGPDEMPPTDSPNGLPMPSVEDERRAYEAFGWTWAAEAEPNFPSDPGYTVADPDIHGDTEADDLWNYAMAYTRSQEEGYRERAEAWARYFKEDYRNCVGGSGSNFCYDRDAFGADHMWGWGLISWYEMTDDAAALAEATALAGVLETLYAPNTPFGCLPSNACTNYGVRQAARQLLLVTRVAEVTGDPRWEGLRDQILDLLLTSAEWDEQYGMYFYGEWSTDQDLGEGSWASGDRLVSPFQIGSLSEAFDQAYRVTGRPELRDRMVRMAEFVDEYGLDETYQYAASSFGIVGGQPYHSYSASEPVDFWDPVYTTALVNILVRGYRYTCEPRFHERARHFFERGNKGIYGSPSERAAPDGVVHHFVDTRFASAHGDFYLDYNKGELQYTYLLFAPLEDAG